MCIKGFCYCLSHDCHLDMDPDILALYCWSSLGDSVDLLSRTNCTAMVVGDWCIILKRGCL